MIVQSLSLIQQQQPMIYLNAMIQNLLALLETHKQLFNASSGRTTITEHFIPTTGNIKVPPRRVPVN